MTRRRAVAVAGPVALLAAAVADLLGGQGDLPAGTVLDALRGSAGALQEAVVLDVRLPRAAAGAVAGGALAAATVLLQGLTRNRLAEPGTLGLTSGGMLAVTATTAYATAGSPLTTIAVAFGGVLAGALFIGGLAAATGAGAVRLVLAGMAVTLALAAVTAAIQLVRETETSGLFLWGAGSLLQNGWEAVRVCGLAAAAALAGALALGRALDVAVLGDAPARALGQRAGLVRAGAGLLAAVLIAAAVAVAGPIAFAGLVGVAIARVARPSGHRGLLLLAVPWGGAVVLAADVLGRLVLGTESETPAGVMCALIGAPLLVAAAVRLRGDAGPVSDRAAGSARLRPVAAIAAVALLPVAAIASLSLGDLSVSPLDLARTVTGGASPLAEIAIELRAPRLCVALAAGACLAAAGTVLQGAARNPLASPELMGVSGGASVAAFVVLLVLPSAPTSALPFAAFAGGIAALALVLALAGGRRGTPVRVAVVGLAVTAACTAVTTILILESTPSASVAIAWLAGSTYASGWHELALLAAPAAILIPLAFLAVRRLDALGLGDDTAAALGVPVGTARPALLALGAALAATAVAVTGAMAFVGLVAPHAARLVAGGNHRRLLPVAIALGMALVAAADTIGRTVAAPTELPSGLVVSLIGAPYLAWLLWRSRGATAAA